MASQLSLLDRRRFLRKWGMGSVAIGASLWGRSFLEGSGLAGVVGEDALLAGRPLVRYPGKTDLILLTSRPPQLETPMKYFGNAITPNDAFNVRYHIHPPTEVDLSTWRLKVAGHVDKPLELSSGCRN
jgi:sulfite dehydrogenase (cytochrome) subunit A